MKYSKVVPGIFLDRPNRFLANVLVDGNTEMVHVRNSGRCREILVPGTRIYLEKALGNHQRKTRYAIISAYKGSRLINIDSQIPNELVSQALINESLEDVNTGGDIKREVTYQHCRFDMMYHHRGKKGFIEVKGVTLERDGVAYFPDAPTSRGSKHIRELITAFREGYEVYIIFIIQLKGVGCLIPNDEMDPEFGMALRKANSTHLKIRAYDCLVREQSIDIDQPVKIIF